MTIHKPGRPEDLPDARTLWARWAFIAAVRADSREEQPGRTGYWIDAEGLHWDDSACTVWTLSPQGEGRFLLYGEEEVSEVRFYEPPIDVLAGGPAWLPFDELRERYEDYQAGTVYWYENGAWARAPYPDDLRDDGLASGLFGVIDRDELLRELIPHLEEAPGLPDIDSLLTDAEAYRLAPRGWLERLRPGPPYDREPDLPAVARTLAATGITTE
ncbi:hypothetical protein [Nocardia sp. AG03]|uniref:hypothetical protein n=1 Tax=Nocardia sp. AG03 TaxID=3025312 RepID=UPI002418B247|nr:hypothetical protein [Nocardia sp. AG03]